MEEPDDLIRFEDDSLSPPHFVITSPSLVYKYSQHLGQLECLNWNSPLMIRPEQRVFSINNNLKVAFYKPIIDSSKPEEGTNSPHTKAFLIVFLYVWTGRISSRIGHFCPSIRGLTARWSIFVLYHGTVNSEKKNYNRERCQYNRRTIFLFM